MNIINKLTLRHLKDNKRTSLVTIIGVIISVAMITAVATLGVSFLDLMKRQAMITEGEWHIQYKNVNNEQITALESDGATEKLFLTNNKGYAKLSESKNENKPYVFITQYDELGFKQMAIQLSEGRLPSAANEIVISEEIEKNVNFDLPIGSELTLEIGERLLIDGSFPLKQIDPLQMSESGLLEKLEISEKTTYSIVGKIKVPTWEPSWSPGYTVIGFIDRNKVTNENPVNALVVLNKVNGSLYEHSEQLVAKYKIEDVDYNSALLRYHGVTNHDNLRTTLFSLAGIIMIVIVIGSVSLIYNAFAISVTERTRHLGMLSSVGATKIQKRNSVFFEGAVIGTISIPLGLIFGIVGITITFLFINTFLQEALNVDTKLEVVVTPYSLFVAVIVSIITILISTYVPARKASRISAIDAIRQTEGIKLTGKVVKTSKLVRKLFGLEGELGLKNLKRNRRKYQATVFSLVISIVLFLSVSFFTENFKKSIELSQQKIDFDIQVTSSHMEKINELRSIRHQEEVTDMMFVQKIELQTLIPIEDIAKELLDVAKQYPEMLVDGKYPYYVILNGIDDESFEAYAKEVGVKTSGTHPTAIVLEKVTYDDGAKQRFVQTKAINTKVGKELQLVQWNYETDERIPLGNLEIAALTEIKPIGSDSASLGGIDVFVSESTLQQLVAGKEAEKEVNGYIYLTSSNSKKTQETIEEMKSSNVYVYNVEERRKQSEQMVLLMSVFTYGFIALISLISIANIFNTISTSIWLRKREFAMLRSVGLTPRGFNKMINYESIFYGIKSLLYGLPISGAVMVLIYWSMRETFEYEFEIPWLSIMFVIIMIFTIVSLAMLYSISKIKKQNIIEGLKQEVI